ncbi:MAG: hypothetical protein M1428_00175 [Deltaproteobacteria bacterium]|nr:hypothetical protein [Deltaproteobacteria bacterium]
MAMIKNWILVGIYPAKKGVYIRYILKKISPAPLFQRGEFLPFVKGGRDGF